MKKILWLASWYPHEEEPLNGDFIERHAKAASLYNHITVLYVVKDNIRTSGKKIASEVITYNENCSAHIYYYRKVCAVSIIESLLSSITYFRLYLKLIRDYIAVNGKPHLVHVHVAYRAGLLALYLKRRYRISYVITEHWSLFLDMARPAFREKSFVTRFLIRKIYRNALRCSAVSKHLAESISARCSVPVPVIIPNVVDTDLFKPGERSSGVFTFIHISTLNYPKNIEQIFEGLSLLEKRTKKTFRLTVYGPLTHAITEVAEKYGLSNMIEFRGEVPQAVLADEIRKHDALILYSRYEGFGCVIIEAHASGLPVIVSDISAMHEIVEDEVNGIIVPLNNPSLLAGKMLWMMDNIHLFDKRSISERASGIYGFRSVGKQFDEFYCD